MSIATPRRRPLAISGLVLLVAGCGTGGGAAPPADVARTALEKALTTWKDGGRPGLIAGTDPPVQAVDSKWQGGLKLGSFEILREEPGESDRRFAVRLIHPSPAGDAEARYMVIGQGPIWVYRDEDYQRFLNMEDNPAQKKATARRR